jgi:hypothetical protein
MDHRDIRDLLDPQKFEAFDLVLNNGDRFKVKNPRFAIVTRTALYFFRTRDGKIGEGPPTVVAMRNIAQIEPTGKAA